MLSNAAAGLHDLFPFFLWSWLNLLESKWLFLCSLTRFLLHNVICGFLVGPLAFAFKRRYFAPKHDSYCTTIFSILLVGPLGFFGWTPRAFWLDPSSFLVGPLWVVGWNPRAFWLDPSGFSVGPLGVFGWTPRGFWLYPSGFLVGPLGLFGWPRGDLSNEIR